jgi:hypothetical protein
MRPVQPDAGPLLAGLEKDLQTINEAAERAAEIAGRTLHQPVKV